MRRFLFPFFRPHHKFLLDKWWFRLLILIYLGGIVASPFIVSNMYVENATGWCWQYVQHLTVTGAEQSIWEDAKNDCMEIHKEIAPYAYAMLVFTPIVLHYLVMFVFFKVIVDFIALGRFRHSN